MSVVISLGSRNRLAISISVYSTAYGSLIDSNQKHMLIMHVPGITNFPYTFYGISRLQHTMGFSI
jgi:hypothetical protein